MLRSVIDRAVLPLRLRAARRRGTFVRAADAGEPLEVEAFETHFPAGEAAYNALGVTPGGTICFAIGTKRLDAGARLFAFDGVVRELADLDRSLSPQGVKTIPQGKVHVDFAPIDGVLYGATHIGYYTPGPVERPATAPGFEPYRGGWFFAIDGLKTVPIAQAPAGEGIIAMTADASRGLLHALTWPHALLLTCSLQTRRVENHGPVLGRAESGTRVAGDWSRVCRSLGVEPESGEVFWSDMRGRIHERSRGQVAMLPREEMWRKVVWHRDAFYGLTWDSESLFRFDPRAARAEEIGALGIEPRGRARAATLAFALDGDVIRYLATGPGLLRDRDIQLASSVSYQTFSLASRMTTTSGPLRLADGRYVTQAQSLLLHDGFAYTIGWVEVPRGDHSTAARTLRRLRRDTPEFRSRGYAEEMMLVRFRV